MLINKVNPRGGGGNFWDLNPSMYDHEKNGEVDAIIMSSNSCFRRLKNCAGDHWAQLTNTE